MSRCKNPLALYTLAWRNMNGFDLKIKISTLLYLFKKYKTIFFSYMQPQESRLLYLSLAPISAFPLLFILLSLECVVSHFGPKYVSRCLCACKWSQFPAFFWWSVFFNQCFTKSLIFASFFWCKFGFLGFLRVWEEDTCFAEVGNFGFLMWF